MGLKTSKLQRLTAAIATFKTKLSNDKVVVKQEAVAEAVQTVASGGSSSSSVDWANITNKPSIPAFTVSGTSLYITT
jgi:hypothetical protein